MKKYTIGDIHGNYRGLKQCLELSNFDFENDLLISLGDIIDGYSESKECFDLLMTIKNFIFIKGNHDEWFQDYLTKPHNRSNLEQISIWKHNGGISTINSFGDWKTIDKKYVDFLNTSINYYVDDENRLFVHAGYNTSYNISEKIQDVCGYLRWDRYYIKECLQFQQLNKPFIDNNFKEVFLGHTPTSYLIKNHYEPLNFGNVYNLDTASGFDGKLTLMNIETKEFFQSEKSPLLYPNEKGRNR